MAEPVQIDFAKVAQRIDAAKQILITTHARSDGDAIGSCLALSHILTARGKTAHPFLHEAVGDRYAFLTESAPIQIWDPKAAASQLAAHDLLVVVDTCSANQLGVVAEAIRSAKIEKIAIDHHRTRDDIVDEALIDDRAAACAQIITMLCEKSGWPIDARAAELLYSGLATDTGWFRFSNASGPAYSTAARLVDLGASPNQLYERLYLNESATRLRLVGLVLASCELHADDRLAVTVLSQEMFRSCNATAEMTEDLINEPMRIGSVIASVLVVEPPDQGPIRVSLRSKRDVDVAAIARSLGGGGHERAAGVRVEGSLKQVSARVTEAVLAAMAGSCE